MEKQVFVANGLRPSIIWASVRPIVMIAGLMMVRPAEAVVRFGNHVYVGGHDFSHQTFDRRHRAIITLYDRPMRGAGCATRRDGHGGTVKRCRLQTIRRGER